MEDIVKILIGQGSGWATAGILLMILVSGGKLLKKLVENHFVHMSSDILETKEIMKEHNITSKENQNRTNELLSEIRNLLIK